VADFGLAKYQAEVNKTFCGTFQWCAPEVMSKTGYTIKADVYSYGVVLWELCTRQQPYAGMKVEDIRRSVLLERKRPDIPDAVDEDFAALISRPSCCPYSSIDQTD
jgi:serine/threonine protein kinase